jgi:hypothetical protein
LEKQIPLRILHVLNKRKPNKKIKVMAYKENEVVAKYTKGNHKSDCGEYNVNDLLEMFDEAEITVDEYGTTDGVTVNDCVDQSLNFPIVTKDLVVTSESDDMFCYYNNEIVVPCSLELDYEFQYQSE